MALTKIPYQSGDVLSADQVNNMQDSIINLEKSKDVNLDSFRVMTSEGEVNNWILNQIKRGTFKQNCKRTCTGVFFGAYGVMDIVYIGAERMVFITIHTRTKIMTNIARPVDMNNLSGDWLLEGWNTLVDITATN